MAPQPSEGRELLDETQSSAAVQEALPARAAVQLIPPSQAWPRGGTTNHRHQSRSNSRRPYSGGDRVPELEPPGKSCIGLLRKEFILLGVVIEAMVKFTIGLPMDLDVSD